MDLTAQTVHSIPGAPLTQTDVSVVQDEGLLTNVQAPSLTRVLNPTAIALDNAAGTGAPFDKKDSVYKVYQRWPEKSTVINGAIGAGAELIRISLNPMTLPARLTDWVTFHRSCIPAIDVVFAIGGAAGTISWLTLGWLGDDTEPATLDTVQQVSCEHVNMNNTAIMRFCLNDNRKSGLYRSLPTDPEKWPCMVLLVNHPALNVQRNDDVNYPIDVYVRFAPNAVFMEPFNVVGGGGDLSTSIDLTYYLKINEVDMLIGGSNVNNLETDMIELPDAGWNTGEFIPHFTERNFLCAKCMVTEKYHDTFYVHIGENPDASDINKALAELKPDVEGYALPSALVFGFGSVPKRLQQAIWKASESQPAGGLGGSVYTIQPYRIGIAGIVYESTEMRVYEFGCVMIFTCPHQTRSNTVNQFSVVEDDINYPRYFPFWSDNSPGDSHVIYNENKGDKVFKLVKGPQLRMAEGGYENIHIGVEPSALDRFYTFTYVQTGNTSTSSSLPSGLKTISIVRPGTTSTVEGNAAFWPIMAPDLRGVKAIFEEWRKKLNTLWIAFDVEVNGQNFGTAAYAEGVMAIRTSSSRLILTGLPKGLIARDIRALSNPSAIPSFNVERFVSWQANAQSLGLPINRNYANVLPRFTRVPMQKESAGMVLGGVAGLTNGLYDFFQQYQRNKWMQEYQQKQLDLARDLQSMKNQNALDLADRNFKQRMSLLGYSAPSANNAQRIDAASVGVQGEPEPTAQAMSTGATTDPVPSTASAATTTTDIRGLGNLNNPSFNSKAFLSGSVPTPFKQAENIGAGRAQNAPYAPPPDTTVSSEEELPGYAAFDPTSIGLPYEEVEDFVRGAPHRSAFRTTEQARQSPKEEVHIPMAPPLPERLLQPGSGTSQNFRRDDNIRQSLRVKAANGTAAAAAGPVPAAAPVESENGMPYDFLRFDDLRMGKRDFTGSRYAPQQFNRDDPVRQGFRSGVLLKSGNEEFNRNSTTRQAFRGPISSNYPPQQFNRSDPLRQPLRDFTGIPYSTPIQNSQSAPAAERLV